MAKSNIDNLVGSILLIELKVLNKKNFNILYNIVKVHSSKEIYIFSDDVENKFLLKLALHFSLHKIHSLDIKASALNNIFEELSKKLTIKREEKHQIEISKKINSLFALLLFKDNHLIFANDKAKDVLGTQNTLEIEQFFNNNEELHELIRKNNNTKIEIPLFNEELEEEWNYGFHLDTLSHCEAKLVTIIAQGKIVRRDCFLSTINRFKFVEVLKDKLIQNNENKVSMALITININNYDKLLNTYGSIAVHDFVKKFIENICQYKESCENLSQWNPHLFIYIVENRKLNDLKLSLDSIHQKLIYNEIDEEISPIITSSALMIDQYDINDIIHSVEQISDRSYKFNDFNSDDFFEINHFNDYIDEDEQIKHYLKTCIGNHTPLKLLNIYKGLCINTSSKILKVQNDTYFVHCENLQGYSMQFENKTVIQAPDLPKDLSADIVYVNIKESYAVLDNLNFLESSANNRESTRVQPNRRTPITIRYQKNSFQGEILDISTQAIALKLNHSLSNEITSKYVDLRFKLLDNTTEEGYSEMKIIGKVLFAGLIDKTKTKLVVRINLQKPYDSYLLRYMYERQKELILELKRAVKLNGGIKK